MPIDYGKESFANLWIILNMVPVILECLLRKAVRQILSFPKRNSKVAPTSGARDQTLCAMLFRPVSFPFFCANTTFPCSPTKQETCMYLLS